VIKQHVRYQARRVFLTTKRTVIKNLVDRPNGLDTADEIDLEALGFDSKDRVRYEPSGWGDLKRCLPRDEVSNDDVFIDFGAGKGRVLIEAAQFPFKRIEGVELAPQLVEVAKTNLATDQRKRSCDDITLTVADVLEYEIPNDLTVAYLANPFRGEIFAKFIERLLEAYDRHPRPLRLIYRVPMEQRILEDTGRFKLVRTTKGYRPTSKWAEKMSIKTYEVIPGQ